MLAMLRAKAISSISQSQPEPTQEAPPAAEPDTAAAMLRDIARAEHSSQPAPSTGPGATEQPAATAAAVEQLALAQPGAEQPPQETAKQQQARQEAWSRVQAAKTPAAAELRPSEASRNGELALSGLCTCLLLSQHLLAQSAASWLASLAGHRQHQLGLQRCMHSGHSSKAATSAQPLQQPDRISVSAPCGCRIRLAAAGLNGK